MTADDDRYAREARRRELAIRLIRLEARVSTVCRWSGVSRQKVRTLQRSIAATSASPAPKRHRGPAPRGIDMFFRTAWARAEASAAAVLCRLYGAIPDRTATALKTVPTVERGERLCEAYETYLDLVSPARLTFEHLVLLVDELEAGEALALESCSGCGAALLVEPATLARRRCECCRATRVPEGVAEGEPTTMPTPPSPEPVAAQGQLF
jgi:hypothetical protein